MNAAVIMNDHLEFLFSFISQSNFDGFGRAVALAGPAGNAQFRP
jgi:hypothetical protein